jgi:hypothetical protein
MTCRRTPLEYRRALAKTAMPGQGAYYRKHLRRETLG